jgi:hypothetical protein
VLLSPGWDIVLGFVLATVLFFFAIGVFVNPVLYFALRGKYREFARGIGAAIIILLILVLGLLLTCIVSPPNHWY